MRHLLESIVDRAILLAEVGLFGGMLAYIAVRGLTLLVGRRRRDRERREG